jgi:uncharacterized membrane protein
MTDRNDSLVADYLERVSRATAGLSADRRDELVRDLREHIETSRADLSVETEAEVRGILERLGDPAVIARAAAEEDGLAPGEGAEPPGARRRRRRRLILIIVGIIVAVALIVGALFFTQDNEGGSATALPAEGISSETLSKQFQMDLR